MDELDTRELRYFVAVAEELSFTGAAERLGITQPSLSRAVRELETKLGTRLFDRSTRRVMMTQPGTVLLDQALPALEAVDAAARLARRAGQAEHRLVVTTSLGLDVSALGATIEAYQRAHPDMPRARAAVRGWERADAMVRDGRADVALLRTPFDRRGLDLEELRSEPQVALVARRHPLAALRRLHVADLAGESVVPSPNVPPADGEMVAKDTARGPRAQDLAQLLEAVALGQIVALMPASLVESLRCPDVVNRPVVDLGPSILFVGWLETSRSLAVAAFVRAACSTYGAAMTS